MGPGATGTEETILKFPLENLGMILKDANVVKMIQDELGTKKIDDKIIDLSTKVVVELFKTLWQRKSFWETALKSVK